MFKTIYDTFIKAIEEKDVETVFYILQNNSIKSIFKMLQDNNDSIFENAQTEIILENKESLINITHLHTLITVDSFKIENLCVHVTISKFTHYKCLDVLNDLIKITRDDSTHIKIDNCSDTDMRVHIIKTGSAKTIYTQ